MIAPPDGWKLKPLLDCTSDGNLSYGVVQPGKHRDDGIPILRVNNFENGALDLSSMLKIDPSIEQKHLRTRLTGGEVLLTLVGSTGQSVIVDESMAGWNVARAIAVIRPSEEVGPTWINICLRSHLTRVFLDSRANTTVQKTLNLTDVRQIPILIPPEKLKSFIESCICTLDDKIELNRRMNETLESMARALFKSWFVDFDPVIDNALAAGNPIPEPLSQRAQTRRDLGTKRKPLPKNIQKLFPDSFVFDEQLGWIPDGWETEPVYEVAQFINGAAFKSSHFCAKEDGLPVVKIAELKNGISAQTKFTDRDMDDKYSIDSGEVLFSWSGSPDTSIDTFVWSGGAGWLNQHIFKVSFHRASERGFVYFMLKHLKPTFVEIARDKQTTGLGHVTARDMKRLFVVKPIESLPEHFATYVDPVLQRAFASSMQSKRLTKLRDTLLPKLLSGELRIPDAEKLVAGSL